MSLQTFNLNRKKLYFAAMNKNTKVTVPTIQKFALKKGSHFVVITDENLVKYHAKKFVQCPTIVIKAGEQNKQLTTVDYIIKELIKLKADRTTTLIGIGGGVVTDIVGFVAATYMRGVQFGFVPTSLLALVDASIGGKNGVDISVFKNTMGTIAQPNFIWHDLTFLKTLPLIEWQNGFAEIIKHACIKDAAMFKQLQQNKPNYYIKNKRQLGLLIEQNTHIKINIVTKDVYENGDRKLLNFGHTLGHAIENIYKLSHGEAIAVGMMFACKLSEQKLGFKQTNEVVALLQQYGLPTHLKINKQKVLQTLMADKKKEGDFINFILLEKIGKAVIQKISVDEIVEVLDT